MGGGGGGIKLMGWGDGVVEWVGCGVVVSFLSLRWVSWTPSSSEFEWYSRRPSYCCDLSVGEAALELMVWGFHCVFQHFEISLPLFSFAFCK